MSVSSDKTPEVVAIEELMASVYGCSMDLERIADSLEIMVGLLSKKDIRVDD